ncbi:MAG: hypothetical protein M3120_00645, partial [Pseudomonadota bacterium]|nr:hypothetical protein [Pseudomonadota bacterium]
AFAMMVIKAISPITRRNMGIWSPRLAQALAIRKSLCCIDPRIRMAKPNLFGQYLSAWNQRSFSI